MPKKRPMQLDDLFRMKAVGRAAISPDGRRIVFELKRFDLDENKNFTQLMVADVGERSVRGLTVGNHSDTLPRWSPDGERLAFLSDRDKGSAIFILNMSGGDARRITDRDGYVRDFAWSPDGKRFVYTYQKMSERELLERDDKKVELRQRPAMKHITRLFHKLDGSGWWNGEYTHVYTTAADAMTNPRQLTSGNYDHSEPRFSPDGRLISFISNRVKDPDTNFENTDIYVMKPTGGAPRKVTQMQGFCAGHSWSPDGKTIAYIGDPAKPGEAHLHLQRIWLVAATGGRPRELHPKFDFSTYNLTLGDVAGLSFEYFPPIWSADSSEVMFLVSRAGAVHLFAQRLNERAPRCLIDGDVNIYSLQRTSTFGPIALSLGTQTSPGDVYLFDPDAELSHDAVTPISDMNRDVFERVLVSAPEPFHIRNGKTELHGWIIRPPNANPRRKYPAILEIHGGPHTQYGCAFFHEMQLMAAKGYVVLLGNPRGSVGYGLKFTNCIHADWGNLDYKDVMRFADHLSSRPYVDSRRIGVTGGSYGGYMTNWLVGHTRRFKAAVTQRSVVNLESMFGTSDFGFDLGKEFGGRPWEKLELYRKQSPLTFAMNIRTPLLIEHEEQDHRCPIEQGEQLFTMLKVLGRTVELVRFEGESHGLSRGGRPQNRRERLRRIIAWFDKYL